MSAYADYKPTTYVRTPTGALAIPTRAYVVLLRSRTHIHPEWSAKTPVGPFQSLREARRYVRKQGWLRWLGRIVVGLEVDSHITTL